MKPSVILFGLDGATFTVLDDLMARGIMPALRQFCREGVRATLKSTVPPLTPTAWSSLATGRTPGNHGVLGFVQYAHAESNSVQLISSKQLTAETIWSMANRQGVRAGSLNFVAHQPAPKIDGWVIPGWVSWRWMRTLSHPAGVIDRLKQAVPGFDVKQLALDFAVEHKSLTGDVKENESWIGLHIDRERQWFNAARYLLEHDPVGLFGIVFDGVDKLQHLLWSYLDPSLQPEPPGEDFIRTRELAWNYFREIDNILAETLRAYGDDSTIIICSDHGFTKTWELFYINTWLAKHGYLTWAEDTPKEQSQLLELDGTFYNLKSFDLERTQAYGLIGSSNGIYINVRGKRDSNGISTERYASLRDEIKQRLLSDCRDPETGDPLVTRVWTREEIFSGPNMENAPDLTVQLRDFGFFSVRRTDSIHEKRPFIAGTHHPEGILIARGPGIRRDAQIAPASLTDVTPTALFAMDLEIPSDLDGQVVTDLFIPEFLASRSPRLTGPATRVFSVSAAAGRHEDGGFERSTNGSREVREEDREVLAKMRDLGYLE